MDGKLDTRSGAHVGKNVTTGGGDFVGRDQTVHGDEVGGDKVGGNKIEVHVHVPPPSDIPPPPPPDNLPRVVGFVGRDQELTYYRQKLESANVAIITGMAGVGKTWLAAQLALQTSPPGKIFWHRCLPNEGVHAVIWAFAGFLAAQGNPSVWQTLDKNKKNELPPLNILLGYLFQALAGQNFLLCLDDVQHLNIDPGYERLVERMRQAVQNGELRLIMTAQQMVTFSTTETQPLAGLTLPDTRHLLATQTVHLPEKLLIELYERTEGNAQLLTLAIQALKQTNDQAKLIERLVRAQEIKNFLLNQVDAGLNTDERLVMQGVAALLEWPGTADEIEEMLESQNVRRTLAFLSNRYLLEESEGKDDTQYDEHAAVKSFYYEMLGGPQRRVLHQRAARYYEQKAPTDFKVVLHYLKAEAYEQAASTATRDTFSHLCTGRAPALLDLLEKCSKQLLGGKLAAQVSLAKGDVYAFLQELELAQAAYQATLDRLATLPFSPTAHKLKVQAYRELGFLFRSSAPADALAWLQEGLTVLAGADKMQRADLQIQIGDVQLRLGNHAEARAALETGLALLPHTPSRLRLLVLINLGIYYYYQNEMDRCSTYFTQALRMAEQLQDPFKTLAMTVNLANLKQTTGDWTAAFAHYTTATKLADQLGDQEEIANVACNLGVLYLHQGELAQAGLKLATALEQSRRYALHDLIITCLAYGAELRLAQQAPEAARIALIEAEALVTTHQIQQLAPFVYTMQAHYFLTVTDYVQSQTYAECAIATAHAQGMGQEEGQALRVLGQIQLALHQFQAAIECCQQSFALLTVIPYEVARTQVVAGEAWLAAGDAEQAKQLWQTARTIFATLDAQRDWAEVNTMMAHESRVPDTL